MSILCKSVGKFFSCSSLRPIKYNYVFSLQTKCVVSTGGTLDPDDRGNEIFLGRDGHFAAYHVGIKSCWDDFTFTLETVPTSSTLDTIKKGYHLPLGCFHTEGWHFCLLLSAAVDSRVPNTSAGLNNVRVLEDEKSSDRSNSWRVPDKTWG